MADRIGCAGRLTRILAAGPKTVSDLYRLAGASRECVRLTLVSNPHLFELIARTGFDPRRAPQAWRLVADPTGARPPCRHCKDRNVCRPRGLCNTCFLDLAVRELYPISTSRYASKGVGTGNVCGKVPAAATTAGPGSDAKIDVMRGRAERGESLSHPDDCDVSAPAGPSYNDTARPGEWEFTPREYRVADHDAA